MIEGTGSPNLVRISKVERRAREGFPKEGHALSGIRVLSKPRLAWPPIWHPKDGSKTVAPDTDMRSVSSGSGGFPRALRLAW